MPQPLELALPLPQALHPLQELPLGWHWGMGLCHGPVALGVTSLGWGNTARGALGCVCPSGAVSILTGMVCPHSAPDGLRGDTLRNVGCGPTVHQLLPACEHSQEIITLDYTEQNCWERKAGAFQWEPVVKYVCELEGDT